MDAIALWQRYQHWLYHHEALGLFVDISRMRFDDAFIAGLNSRWQAALVAMAALEAGAIANPDEHRMVGHYWLRNPDLAPTPALAASIRQTVDAIQTFARNIHTGVVRPPTATRFSTLLCVGIGGSALGPQFVSQCLADPAPAMDLYFIDNTDPDGMDGVFDRLGDRLAETLVVITSKSGGTPETANGLQEVQHQCTLRGLDFAQQAVAVTGEGSALEQRAATWLARFPMHDWVGGRTSELSAVGLLPAALQGIDIQELLMGAQIMDDATRNPDLGQNPAGLLAHAWYFAGNGKGTKDMVILPYKDRLLLFSRYLQQLVMESLGKERDLDGAIAHQGIAVYGNKGSTDQHAYVQQLREGIPNFFATFIEVLKDSDRPHPYLEPHVTSGDYLSGLLQGTRQALYDNGRDSITITIPDVTPRTVGALIALYERAVGFYASLVNINAYHQPGVEAGKKAANEILSLQKRILTFLETAPTPQGLVEISQHIDPQRIESIYLILRHLHSNGRVASTGVWHQPHSLRFAMPSAS
jgi:glucose-6-phosphate isomerase